jgi:hypothetical protein
MKARLKATIKRTRAKLNKAKSAAKSRQPGTAERVSHHSQVLNRLMAGSAAPGAQKPR